MGIPSQGALAAGTFQLCEGGIDMRRGWWVLWLGLACSPTDQICLDDFDQDGVCEDDPCPGDPGNDDDADGICAANDICALGDDALDEDDDGVPDACDTCPEDETNDLDEDGICGKDDPCPTVDGSVCDRTFLVGLQVDYFAAEAGYRVVDSDGAELLAGGFLEAGQTLFVEVPVASEAGGFCIELTDQIADGGVSGFVWDTERGRFEQWWSYYDWSDAGSWCTTIKTADSDPETLVLDEPLWRAVGECQLEVVITTLAYGSETGWSLSTGTGRQVQGIAPGAYADFMTYTYPFNAYEGPHVFTMLDSWGDGWHGGTFEVRVVGSVGEPLARDSLSTGRTLDVPFTVDCPDPEGLNLEDILPDDTGL